MYRFSSNEINELDSQYPFKILPANNNNNNNNGIDGNDEYESVLIKMSTENETIQKSPTEISSLMLNHLIDGTIKKFANEKDEYILNAVVTIPATFDINQREQTQQAGHIYVTFHFMFVLFYYYMLIILALKNRF